MRWGDRDGVKGRGVPIAEEQMGYVGRASDPKGDTVGLTWSKGNMVGGGRSGIRGAEPGVACGNEGRWIPAQPMEEPSKHQNCPQHNAVRWE